MLLTPGSSYYHFLVILEVAVCGLTDNYTGGTWRVPGRHCTQVFLHMRIAQNPHFTSELSSGFQPNFAQEKSKSLQLLLVPLLLLLLLLLSLLACT